ncbi:hypothetical protein KP509_08G050900 [Ceratopteris richardii]|uniref:BHLH domain-containing protein n=1 Tax=Ceratopteris richardii TaxID=49495 RepID=A0A8T2UD50_CERRI|nr:hypothetical protein KP509_08G050900 [Ceratopteris richardii]
MADVPIQFRLRCLHVLMSLTDESYVVSGFKRKKHISDERQRRVVMNSLIETLQTLLPAPSSPRRDRYAVLVESARNIDILNEKIKELSSLKEEVMKMVSKEGIHEATSSDSISQSSGDGSGENSQLGIILSRKISKNHRDFAVTIRCPRIRTTMCHVLKIFILHNFEVTNASFSFASDEHVIVNVHAQIPSGLQDDFEELKVKLDNLFNDISSLEMEVKMKYLH